MSALHRAYEDADLGRIMSESRYKLHPDLYQRAIPLSDSTGRADVRACVGSLASPYVLPIRYIAECLEEEELARMTRGTIDDAVRAEVEPMALRTMPLKWDASVPSTAAALEARDRLQRMRLTPKQRAVVETMLEHGTTNSVEVGEALGMSPATVRVHLAAIRRAAST